LRVLEILIDEVLLGILIAILGLVMINQGDFHAF